MNRYAFLKSILAAFLAPFVVKKATPSKRVQAFYDDRNGHGPVADITYGWDESGRCHIFSSENGTTWRNDGTITFGEPIPTSGEPITVKSYINEVVTIPISKSDIIEVYLFEGDRYNIYELNTTTGEKKLLRSYPTKDLIA